MESTLARASNAIGTPEVERALDARAQPSPAGIASEARAELRTRSRRDYVMRRALALSDVIAITLALLLAFMLSPVAERHLDDALWILPLLPVWILLLRAYGLYGLDTKRINHGALDDAPALFHSFLVSLLITWAWFRALPVHQLTLAEIVTLRSFSRSCARSRLTRSTGSSRSAS
jgi:hypothetical protein